MRLLPLILILSIPLRADPVTPGAAALIAALGGGGAPTTAASAPHGQTLFAWRGDSIPGGPTATVRYMVVSASGAVTTAPTSLPLLPGVNPGRVRAAATPLGFALVWEETGGLDPAFRGIALATFDLLGNVLSAPNTQVNLQTSLDEANPDIAGRADGSFVVCWVRLPYFTSTPTAGVWVRRFNGVGAAIDPIEIRADDPTTSLARQDHPTVGAIATGETVVAWHDGDALANGGNSTRDGSGFAIVGRWFSAAMTPITPTDIVLNAFTVGDQSHPRCATDSLGRTVVAWRDRQIFGTRVHWRRFNGVGTPLMAAESSLAPYPAAEGTLSDIASGQDGDFVISWAPVLGSYLGGAGNLPAGFARFAPCGALIETLTVSAQLPPGRIHTSIDVAMDAFGNVNAIWQGTPTSNGEIVRRPWRRNRIFSTPPSPAIGSIVNLTIDAPTCTANSYQLALSGTPGSLAFGTRIIPLTPDPLFWFTLSPTATITAGFQGPLNLFGPTMGAAVAVPNDPALSGVTFHVAAALYQTGPPLEIQSITNAYPITVQ